jgi:hypothetical protein
MTTIIARPPLEQVARSVPQAPNPVLTSPVTALPPAISDPSSATDGIDLWALAYQKFEERDDEHKLMGNFKAHLTSLQGDAVADADLLSPQWVKSRVDRLLKDREERQWRIPFPGKDINIRTQVEKLARFLLWSDPIVKQAASLEPHAALAWSGVSLLLPVSS